ncbi:MAG TPA: hypothetical protein PKM88_14405, partial [bacterium]|nr:hypothetical protein [bacterium]
KGVIAVLEVLLNTLFSLCHFGLARSALTAITRDGCDRAATLRTMTRLLLVSCLLVGMAGAAGLWYLGVRDGCGTVAGLPVLAVLLFAACLPAKLLFESDLFLLPALGGARGANVLHCGRGLLLLLLWGMAWLLAGTLTVNGIAGLYLISFLLLALLADALLRRAAGAPAGAGASAWTLLRGGAAVQPGYLAMYLLLFVD